MMRHSVFEAVLGECAQRVRSSFTEWETPAFYLQFHGGFEIDGLFDDVLGEVALSSLPSMPVHQTPDSHEPRFLYGRCDGVPVLVCLGHRHVFEGLGIEPCILPTCVAWRLGAKRFVFIDPVLSLLPELKAGNWTLLTDFINGQRMSPLDGLLPLLPTAFPDMTQALSQHLNSELVNALSQVSVQPKLCVYQSLPGSHFCTPAEAVAARSAHVDIVGHDMVMEIIMAHALGGEVSALGLVGEMAPTDGSRPLKREAFLETCRFCSWQMIRGLRLAIGELSRFSTPSGVASLPSSHADELLSDRYRRPHPEGRVPVLKRYLKTGE